MELASLAVLGRDIGREATDLLAGLECAARADRATALLRLRQNDGGWPILAHGKHDEHANCHAAAARERAANQNEHKHHAAVVVGQRWRRRSAVAKQLLFVVAARIDAGPKLVFEKRNG